MFNFTTNVIINSADQFAILDKSGAVTTGAGTGAKAPKMFRVKRYRDFKIGDPGEVVKGVYKAIGYNGVLSKATIDDSAFTAVISRPSKVVVVVPPLVEVLVFLAIVTIASSTSID